MDVWMDGLMDGCIDEWRYEMVKSQYWACCQA